MRNILLFLFFISLFTFFVNARKHPTFSKTYHVKGVLNIPYAELQEPFEAWYDEHNSKSRIDYYGGTVKTIQLAKTHNYGTAIRITPVTTEETTNVETCLQVNGDSDENRISIQIAVPDLTDFQLVGFEQLYGHKCEVWRLTNEVGQKINNYTAYVKWKKESDRRVAVPVKYVMRGFNNVLGSHYDHYYIEYNDYSTRVPQPSVFKVPQYLTCEPYPGPGLNHYAYTFNPMREFIHNDVSHIDHVWGKFRETHKRSSEYKSENEHDQRKNIFHQNFRYIESMNRANLGYQLAVNHLADKTPDEIRVLRGYKYSHVKDNGGSTFPYTLQYLKSNSRRLPKSIDWRLYGAVTPVKDQAVCGSCWAFGTTGTIEGAYFLKHKQQIRLSEQVLVDCSWGFGNNGCDGGEDFRSYQWIMKHGGIPTDAAYGPYLGEDGYCLVKNKTLTARIKQYVNVKPRSVSALKTALVNHGPVTIAIDAAHKSFSFYSSGVYYEPKCNNTPEGLDHQVLVVGYGKLNGRPYWLVKNSWSNYWGNDGYILIDRKNNNCGVMTQPTYVNLY